MRTDPRAACANAEERAGWAFVHDAICHPLMALTNWSGWSVRFHDWTSTRAWPRVRQHAAVVALVPSRRHGLLQVKHTAPGFYAVQHPTVRHQLVCKAGDNIEAAEIAEAWFDTLADVGIYPPEHAA